MDRVRYSYVLTLILMQLLIWDRRGLLANICGDFGPLDPIFNKHWTAEFYGWVTWEWLMWSIILSRVPEVKLAERTFYCGRAMVNKNGGLTTEGGEYDSLSGILSQSIWRPKFSKSSRKGIFGKAGTFFRKWQNIIVKISSFISLRAANFCLLLAGYLTLRGFNWFPPMASKRRKQ